MRLRNISLKGRIKPHPKALDVLEVAFLWGEYHRDILRNMRYGVPPRPGVILFVLLKTLNGIPLSLPIYFGDIGGSLSTEEVNEAWKWN